MVEIIPESNPDLNKNLFLKELSKLSDGITLKIVGISEPKESKRNKKDSYFYIDFKIIDEFKAKLILNDDGTVKNETIDATGDIIAILYTLNEIDDTGNYLINRSKNLFNIINYGMKQHNMIPINNKCSLKATFDEIETALNGLTFKATANLVKSKDFNDYYRLEVLEKTGVAMG